MIIKSLLVSEIANHLLVPFIGENKIIKGINDLKNATANDITFFCNKKYRDNLSQVLAGACLVSEENIHLLPMHVTKIICKDPYLAYAYVVELLYEKIKSNIISNLAYISQSAQIGINCNIDTYSHVGDDVIIGDNTYISSNVMLLNCIVGKNCIIHSGVKIGQDGFGFAINGNEIKKIQHIGKVIIGDDVEIGANTCIDRGTITNTIVGNNTKIDNLVQIGHNVIIGKNCIICAQVGIAGSTIIDDYVVLGGQVGLSGHIHIGSMAQVAAQSGVVNDIPSGAKVGGSPALNIIDWHKQTIFLKKMTKK